MSQGDVRIVPISEEYIESFHKCLDSVARERQYLGFVEAPPLESTRKFVISNISKEIPQYVAIIGRTVVGWCDISPVTLEGFTHCGSLGMGVLLGYRGNGYGKRLMEATIFAAKESGIERVELEVYASNIPAIRLYEKRGFVHEGVKKNARKLDGQYDDVLLMALFI
ncbi:GNAT family N-acetyltransferase [Candidatus Bathyarchaeota archaeon]|jgi:RimJ/RimL family protein N-acetyltransferase|nr:GNAT family N-acetyltransferase [Candidatus Bathyarchaeota archaeon]MBT7346354.1 GNAT family N-acetyltransferase [Candidatus Bathyarchaeota archaeon]